MEFNIRRRKDDVMNGITTSFVAYYYGSRTAR